jgi:hypothetical protein
MISDVLTFLDETNHNNGIGSPPPPAVNMSTTHPIRIFPLDGYISKKRPDCFVWENGYFEKGAEVILGNSGRLARVMGICGLGKNYVMMRMNEMATILDGEVRICRMVVSSPPTSAWISLLQSFIVRFFKPVLKSMRDFVDEERLEGASVPNDSESGSGSGSEVLTSPDEIEGLGDSGLSNSEESI